MSNRIPIAIIGAGPTGLMLACELARHHVPFRIFDQHPERALTANAVSIQTRTLEILDNIGIIQPFLKLGHACDGIMVHVGEKDLGKLSFADLDSFYHYILTLPQSETERLLIEHLASFRHEVERPLTLTHIHEKDDHVICTFQNPEGNTDTIEATWLISCDGANSSVRHFCNIDFPGEDLNDQCMVANTEMSTFLSTSNIHIFLDKGTFLITIPFGSHRYRIGVNLHQSPRKYLIEKEVKEIVQERSKGNYDVNSVSWISPFWVHSKIVPHLRHRSIFFAGDAAHIHFPLAGQGMNTGVQDAYNLAWKLALVIKGQAKPSILDSYHEERHPVLHAIVKHSERLTKLALLKNPFLAQIRHLIVKLLTTKKNSMRLTHLDLKYKKSLIISYSDKVGTKAPRPGERAPDVVIHSSLRLHDYLRNTQHNILLFTGPSSQSVVINKIKQLQQELSQRYSETVNIHIVSEATIDGIDNLILDKNAVIHKRYGVKSPALFIIRPDDYLACCSKKMSLQTVSQCLGKYLT